MIKKKTQVWWNRCLHGRICQREFVIDNLRVRIHLIIEMIRWTVLVEPVLARQNLPGVPRP